MSASTSDVAMPQWQLDTVGPCQLLKNPSNVWSTAHARPAMRAREQAPSLACMRAAAAAATRASSSCRRVGLCASRGCHSRCGHASRRHRRGHASEQAADELVEERGHVVVHVIPDLLPQQAPARDQQEHVLDLLLQVDRAGLAPLGEVLLHLAHHETGMAPELGRPQSVGEEPVLLVPRVVVDVIADPFAEDRDGDLVDRRRRRC